MCLSRSTGPEGSAAPTPDDGSSRQDVGGRAARAGWVHSGAASRPSPHETAAHGCLSVLGRQPGQPPACARDLAVGEAVRGMTVGVLSSSAGPRLPRGLLTDGQ